MKINFQLALFALLPTSCASFVVQHKNERYPTAIVETEIDKAKTEEAWVAKEFNRGPPDWILEDKKQDTKPQAKEYDWFGAALKADIPPESPPTLQNWPVSDPFSGAMAPVTPEIAPAFNNNAPSEWFTSEMKSGRPALKQLPVTDWFTEAIHSGPSVQPDSAPSFGKGSGEWFAQAIASEGPPKPSDAPPLKKGTTEWFSEVIQSGIAEAPNPVLKLKKGPTEWFSQEIASHARPVSLQATQPLLAMPPGPTEWYSEALKGFARPTRKMTPNEWFSVGHVDEKTPPTAPRPATEIKDGPHEWFKEALSHV